MWIPNIAYCLLILLTVLNKATLHICWFWANPHLRSPSFFCYDICNFNFWGPSCFSGEHGHVSAGDVLPHAVWRHQHSGELPPPCGPAVAAGSHFCPLLREPLHLHHRTHGWDQPKSRSESDVGTCASASVVPWFWNWLLKTWCREKRRR